MRPFVPPGLLAVIFVLFFSVSVFGSPLSSRLLPLVPPGAEIVGGFEGHGGPHTHGRLLLTTHNNRLDLEDFEALTGVDSERIFDEVIEVAAAPPGGGLSEHLLLVSGRFNQERIQRSLELNGDKSFPYEGQQVLLIRPLTRERGDMLDTRWMIILENRTCIFGTRWLVQQALRRYVEHSVPDSVLEERLSLLRSDVTSWNVLAGLAQNQKSIYFAPPFSVWAQLQEDADVLMVAARFGPKIRVDFSIHASAERGPEFFTRKAGFFADALLDKPEPETASPRPEQQRLENFSLEPSRVQGSVHMSPQQFGAWCEHLYLARAGIIAPSTNGD